MEIEGLESISKEYDYHIASAEEMEQFREPTFEITVSIDDMTTFYANIEALDEKLNTIAKYAVGIERKSVNIIRYDNSHEHPKLSNPPHHLHKYANEKRVSDFDGSIDTLILGIEEAIAKLS
jgi:hypothetical protein